jgi:hypothetical protein
MTAASDYDGPPLTASALIAADETRRAVSAADRPLEPDEPGKHESGPLRPFRHRPVASVA